MYVVSIFPPHHIQQLTKKATQIRNASHRPHYQQARIEANSESNVLTSENSQCTQVLCDWLAGFSDH